MDIEPNCDAAPISVTAVVRSTCNGDPCLLVSGTIALGGGRFGAVELQILAAPEATQSEIVFALACIFGSTTTRAQA